MDRHIQTIIFASAVALTACTAVTVKPLDANAGVKSVCIQENPKVLVSDLVTVIRDGFDRHGIATEVFSGAKPANCEYVLTYTAFRAWDMAPYLRDAQLRLEKEGRQIASADYHLKGGGGFSLMKWQSTKSKMDPVIDQLLSAK